MSTRPEKRPTLTSVIRDGHVAGFLLSRGPQGVEAWTASEASLGIYETVALANAAVVAEAQGTT